MAAKQDLTSKAEDAEVDGEPGQPEPQLRDFVSFFGSLVSLVGFGLGFLPNSTAGEKFLVIIAAIALSWAIALAIKLVPMGRPAAWLAAAGAVLVASLCGLSVVAERTASAPVAQVAPVSSGAARPGGRPTAAAYGPSKQKTSPSASAVPPSPQVDYLLEYRSRSFEMPGDSCQDSNSSNASNVTFTQDAPKVTVSDDGGGDIDVYCDVEGPSLEFSEQTAPVIGHPDPAQCAAAITTMPNSGSVSFGQLQPGTEFCFIAKNGTAAGPLVLATLKSVNGSTFGTTWTATAWRMPLAS
jgi:hypothetical protein